MRGGLGQFMDVGALDGHEFDIQAMLDRGKHPARGRRGGHDGAPTLIARDDGTPMQVKGKQFVPHGHRVNMAFPGGAGYGPATDRDVSQIKRDLAQGYISEAAARESYGLSDEDIAEVHAAVAEGRII